MLAVMSSKKRNRVINQQNKSSTIVFVSLTNEYILTTVFEV